MSASAAAAAAHAPSASIKYPFCVKWKGGSPFTDSGSVLTRLKLSFGAGKEVLVPIPTDVSPIQKLKIQRSKVGSSLKSALLCSSEQISTLAVSAIFRKTLLNGTTLLAEFSVTVREHEKTEFPDHKRFILRIGSNLHLSLVEKQLRFPMSFVWKGEKKLNGRDIKVVDILKATRRAELTADPKTNAMFLSVVRGAGMTATRQTSELEQISLTEEQLRRIEVSLRSFESYAVKNIRIVQFGGGYSNPQRAVRIDSLIPLSIPPRLPNHAHLLLQVSNKRAILSDLTQESHLVQCCTPLFIPIIHESAVGLVQACRLRPENSFDPDVHQLIQKIEPETLNRLFTARMKMNILQGACDQGEVEAQFHSLLSLFLDSFQDETLVEWCENTLKLGFSREVSAAHAVKIKEIAQHVPAKLREALALFSQDCRPCCD